MNSEQTFLIKKHAQNLGFFACGIAKAGELSDDKIHFENYLQRGDFGEMNYLAHNPEKRLNPTLILENAKSVIVVLYDYSHHDIKETPEGKIAKYAIGEGYHDVIKSKLVKLEDEIFKIFPDSTMCSIVATPPIFQKAWAIKAGLGFRGKNTLLINPKIGSYCNIGVILLDQELAYDTPLDIKCHDNCLLCIEHCPTNALEKPYQLNAKKCIAYYNTGKTRSTTIDLHGWAKGCDDCQICCPYNA